MTVKTSWPWITALVAIAVALTPIGTAVLGAVTAGEQLARQIGTLLFAVGFGGLLLLALIEFGVRKFLMRRQRRVAIAPV